MKATSATSWVATTNHCAEAIEAPYRAPITVPPTSQARP